jgi:hypothetical protein
VLPFSQVLYSCLRRVASPGAWIAAPPVHQAAGVHRSRAFSAPAGKTGQAAEAQTVQNFGTTSGIMADAEPRTHRPADVGRVYPLPKKTVEKVFPEGLAGLMHKMLFGLTRRRHGPEKNSNRWYEGVLKEQPGVLIRKEAMHIISALYCLSKTGVQKGTPQIPSPGFLLDGPPGAGKSMILNHCVHWARSTGEWIVVFLPEASRLMLGLGLFQRGDGEDSHKIYQPEFAELYLKHIHAANHEKLKQVLYAGEGGGNCAEAMEAFFAQTSSAKEKNSVGVLTAVMESLQTQTAFPVLVAVDEINALQGMSLYTDANMDLVPASNIVLAELFGRFLQAGYKRGVVVGAASRTGRYQNVPLPSFSRKPIQVPGISREDIKTFLAYQQNVGELFTPISDELLDYLYFVTGGRWVDS